MSTRLDTYLASALALVEKWDGDRQVISWALLKHALPVNERTRLDAPAKLSSALDVLGRRCSPDGGGRFRLWSCYAKTGAFDQASLLARAFRKNVFGPEETLGRDTFIAVANCAAGSRKHSEQALQNALVRAGFAIKGQAGSASSIKLRLEGRNDLRLAPVREFVVSKSVPADCLLQRHFSQYPSYRSAAQRDVVREVLNDDGAKTIIARMPTGGGKSLTFLLPAAEWRQRGEASTVIVISPVIALMNDMMRKIERHYGKTGLSAAQINSTVPPGDRTQIYRSLRQGKLDVLFLSPEKVVEPFFRETMLASSDHLRLLVIDEAHMVPEWGQDFRTDFFRLGQVQRRLIEHGARLKTLFLSATLTLQSERSLLRVFGDPDGVVRFEEAALRRELSIRVGYLKNHEDKLSVALPLVEKVDKPCIVYCGQKTHVKEIQAGLRERGLHRAFSYTGNTSPNYRRERLDAFHDGDVDVVVATNAFGLGIDKQDVRSVIHFDVPTNLDAYYQEIGRCARDARTGHAFLLYTPASMGHAVKSTLAKLKTETAFARANAMLKARFELPADGSGACLLPLHATAAHIIEDSTLNRSWNFATLNLLEQVGDLDVGTKVLRHIEVRREKNRSAWNRAKAKADTALAISLIGEQLGRKNSGVLDLASVSKRKKVSFFELEAGVVRAALWRGIELTPLDEDSGQSWVFVRRKQTRTWSKQHEQRLERFRDEQMQEAKREVGELRGFVKTRGCRLAAFAKLYGIPFSGRCGHCDRCDPRLAYR